MPNLPKQPKPRNKPAVRHAWTVEYTAARDARAAGNITDECIPSS